VDLSQNFSLGTDEVELLLCDVHEFSEVFLCVVQGRQLRGVEPFVEVDHVFVEGELQCCVPLLGGPREILRTEVINDVGVIFAVGGPFVVPEEHTSRRRLAFGRPVVVHIVH